MVETTIQKDVVDNENVEVKDQELDTLSTDDEVTPPVSPRDQLMADLGERRRQEHAEESTDQDEGEEDPPEVVDEMVDLKVNGEIIQRPQSEVDAAGGVAAIQKDISGDMKLAQAAEAQKLLDQNKEFVQNVVNENQQLKTEVGKLQDLVKQQTEAGVEDTPEAEAELAAKAKEIADGFFRGDSAQLEEAVKTLLESGKSPAPQAPVEKVDTTAIAAEVTANIAFEKERREASDLFEKDHADLNDVPGRRHRVNQFTLIVQKEHPDWGPKEIIGEAITRTRDDLAIPKPVADTIVEKTPLEKKRDRKAATVDKIPTASDRGKPPQSGFKPKTPDELFEDIKSKRSHG